jgi:hypothetical protein
LTPGYRFLVTFVSDSTVQSSLSKHLLRTLGLELVDTLITYHAYLDQRKTFVPAFDQCLDIPWKISVEDHQREELLNGMRVEDQANAAKARGIATAGKVNLFQMARGASKVGLLNRCIRS